MKTKIITTILLAFAGCWAFGQKPKNGTYLFSIRDAEYVNNPIVAKCKVIIKGDSVKVIYTDSSLTNIQYGDIFDKGILIRHRKSKQWIIGHSKKDIDAKEIGGCSDGPRVINFKRKEIWNC